MWNSCYRRFGYECEDMSNGLDQHRRYCHWGDNILFLGQLGNYQRVTLQLHILNAASPYTRRDPRVPRRSTLPGSPRACWTEVREKEIGATSGAGTGLHMRLCRLSSFLLLTAIAITQVVAVAKKTVAHEYIVFIRRWKWGGGKRGYRHWAPQATWSSDIIFLFVFFRWTRCLYPLTVGRTEIECRRPLFRAPLSCYTIVVTRREDFAYTTNKWWLSLRDIFNSFCTYCDLMETRNFGNRFLSLFFRCVQHGRGEKREERMNLWCFALLR